MATYNDIVSQPIMVQDLLKTEQQQHLANSPSVVGHCATTNSSSSLGLTTSTGTSYGTAAHVQVPDYHPHHHHNHQSNYQSYHHQYFNGNYDQWGYHHGSGGFI